MIMLMNVTMMKQTGVPVAPLTEAEAQAKNIIRVIGAIMEVSAALVEANLVKNSFHVTFFLIYMFWH